MRERDCVCVVEVCAAQYLHAYLPTFRKPFATARVLFALMRRLDKVREQVAEIMHGRNLLQLAASEHSQLFGVGFFIALVLRFGRYTIPAKRCL